MAKSTVLKSFVVSIIVGFFCHQIQAEEALPLLTQGDAAYARRAEGQTEGRGKPEWVDKAIGFYRQAVDQDPQSFMARWKLAQALNFKAVYIETDKKVKQALLTESKDIGEKSVKFMEARLRQQIPASGEIYLTLGLSWGEWALVHGKLAAVKKGVAAKIRDLAQRVIDIDPALENAGGHRLLGRLHHQSPKVPLFTGWVSKKKALEEIAKAYEIAPDYLFNKQFYAEALYDFKKDRSLAKKLLEEVVSARPDSINLLEDLRSQRESQEFLQTHKF